MFFLLPVVFPLVLIVGFSLIAYPRQTIAYILQSYNTFNALKFKYWYRTTPENKAHERLCSGQAWDEFCDTLKSAKSAISAGPTDELSQAEGYRFLARVTRAGLAVFLEYQDTNAPKLHSLVGETIKMGADNPDNVYQSAPLKRNLVYRLYGTRGTVKYLSFGIQKGHYGKRMGMPAVSFLDSSQLKYYPKIPAEFMQKHRGQYECKRNNNSNTVNDEQYFEILFSTNISKLKQTLLAKQKKQLNFLSMDAEEDGTLIVRQTFGIRENETPAFLILDRYYVDDNEDENETKVSSVTTAQLTDAGHSAAGQHGSFGRPLALQAFDVDESLKSAANLVCGASLMFSRWGSRMRHCSDVNKLPVLLDQTKYLDMGGDPNIFYYHSYFELGLQEALVIQVAIPEQCLFWNFQLNNHWMESLDYRYFPIHINSDRAVYNTVDEQKGVCIIVCHEQYLKCPDVLPNKYSQLNINWLSTAYHFKGTMLFRWLNAIDFEHPSTNVIKLNI